MMIAGAQIGQAIGGAGVLFVAGFMGFGLSYLLVPIAVLGVTACVVLSTKETVLLRSAGGGWAQALADMRDFVRESFRSFLGSRGTFAGVAYALLPHSLPMDRLDSDGQSHSRVFDPAQKDPGEHPWLRGACQDQETVTLPPYASNR